MRGAHRSERAAQERRAAVAALIKVQLNHDLILIGLVPEASEKAHKKSKTTMALLLVLVCNVPDWRLPIIPSKQASP